MRGNIVELLFACKYIHNSDDNNLGTVEHNATCHQSNNNEDVSRGDKELKDSLDGGMDVKGKMVGFDQGIMLKHLRHILTYLHYLTGLTMIIMLKVVRFCIFTSGAPKSRLARQQHEPRVLVEETSKKKLGVTKRKFEEENGIAKQMKMQRITNVMQDDLWSQPRIRTDIVQDVLRRPQVLVDEIEVTARKFTEENELAKQTKRQRITEATKRNQNGVLKVSAELNEVVGKSANSAPPSEKSSKKSSSETTVPDVASISEFMTQVAGLVELVDSRDIMELKLKQDDCEVLIRKKEALPPPPAPQMVMMQSSQPQAMYQSQPPPPQAAPASSAPAPSASPAALPTPAKQKSSHPPLKSPMAGTFYRAPAPGAPAFVKVGDKVQKGQVVCIIEAMKLMNEIEVTHFLS
ncbi:biotin carboxyl carrier protein of acetyl-CoA carboxylase, chloroplastic-like protein [Tanacetum coccineum]